MARKLRVVVAGGWYHVLNRGNHREAIFRADTDRRRFLGRLAELPERFRTEIHAFVLMENHYHLLIRTVDANLSEAIRWLQVSYSSVFNWAHGIRGHLFQGRFRSLLIEDVQGVGEVARYLHLNPVRVGGLGLGKSEQRRARVVGIEDPGEPLVTERLRLLAEYPWSSWRVYAGSDKPPEWLSTDVIAGGCGGRTAADRRRALKEYTEEPVRQGRMESPWEQVVGGLVLGSKEFAATILMPKSAGVEADQRGTQSGWLPRPEWKVIVELAEKICGRPWSDVLEAHGNWIRDAVMYVAVRYEGHRLAEVYREIPGLKYPAAAQAVKRFERRLAGDAEKERFVQRLRRALEKR